MNISCTPERLASWPGKPPKWLIEHWATIDRWRAEREAEARAIDGLQVCRQDEDGNWQPVSGWKIYRP
jgi:hypothetical protein